MPNKTVPAAATGLPDDDHTEAETLTAECEQAARDFRLEASRIFDKRYSDWLAARAAKELFDDDDDVGKYEELYNRQDDAAKLLMSTPAAYACDVWHKFEVLEHSILKEIMDGPHIEKPFFAYLGYIKADLLELGIG
jgi:hypothetical protein